MTSRRLAFAAALAAVLLPGVVAPAAPANVDVDVAPSGAADLVWSDGTYSSFRERTQAADGTFGATTAPTGTSYVDSVATAVDQTGKATILWQANDSWHRVMVRRRSAGGTLGPAQIVGEGTGDPEAVPAMALGADGTAIIVWVGYVNRRRAVQGRRLAPDGTLSEIRTFGTYYPMVAPTVGVDAAGVATVAWQRLSPAVLQTRRWRPDGSLGTTVNLTAVGGNARDVQLGVAADGSATFVWAESVETGDGWAERLRLRVRRPDGTLTTAAQATPATAPAAQRSFTLAMQPDGVAALAWYPHSGTGPRTRAVSRTGAMSPVTTVVSATTDAPAVVLDGSGNAVFAWQERISDGQWAFRTRRRAAGGEFGPVATVVDPGRGGSTALDVSADGTVTFLWGVPFNVYADQHFFTRRQGPTGELTPVTALANP